MLGQVATQTHPFKRCGVFLCAINIEAFTPIEAFKEGLDALIDDVKSSRLSEGFDEILVAGEPEWREMERRQIEGIHLDDEIYNQILDTASSLGINTTNYRGRSEKLKVTHPSYTLEYKYE